LQKSERGGSRNGSISFRLYHRCRRIKKTPGNRNPDATIGIASKDYLKKMLAESFDVFTFSPVGVSVYQLGNFRTARKQLKAWD
jgi:hypothetical protein